MQAYDSGAAGIELCRPMTQVELALSYAGIWLRAAGIELFRPMTQGSWH